MHEVLVNRLGGLSLPRKSVVRLTDRPDMTLDVYRGRKTTKPNTMQTEKTWIALLGLLPKIQARYRPLNFEKEKAKKSENQNDITF